MSDIIDRSYDDGEADDDDGDGKIDISRLTDREWVDVERLQAEMDRIGEIEDLAERKAEARKFHQALEG